MKKLFLALTLTLFFLGCNKDIPEVNFEELTIEKVSELNCNPEEENCAFIGFKIPWATGKDTRSNLINSHIKNHLINLVDYQETNEVTSLEKLAQTFIQDYEASAREFPEYNIPWEAYVEGNVTYETEKLISIRFDLALFTGGAHGYTSVSFLNFDPTSGRIITKDELLSTEFKDFAESKFRKQANIPENEAINSTGYFFEDDKFQLPQNIGFNANRLILIYNAYEIASYSEGNIELEFEIEEVRKYIKIL